MQSSSAHLLGLPPELRLNIYDHVFQQHFDISPLDGFELERHYPRRPKGLQGSYVKINEIRTQPAYFSIPWLNFKLSCRAIAQEIQKYMESSRYLDADQNRTLEMDLKPKPAAQGEGISLVLIAWRRVPCPPREMRRLIVHNNGAAITVMPALNLFLHCGISMDRARPLQEHLVLDELIVNVLSTQALAVPDQTPGFEPVDELARTKPEFEHTHAALKNYHQAGKLAGYIGKIHISGEGKNDEFKVVHPFRPGFHQYRWGVSEVR